MSDLRPLISEFCPRNIARRTTACRHSCVPKRRTTPCRHGHKLTFDEKGNAVCPESSLVYKLTNGKVNCESLDEESMLPQALTAGTRTYRAFKKECARQ